MAALADDSEENRQTCIDVLCAYLRMPYAPDPGDEAPGQEQLTFRANREVRHTIIRVITAHRREGAVLSWEGLDFDFTGVVFDGGDFSGAKFSGGTVRLTGAEFSGGEVYFVGAEFSGSNVDFGGTLGFDGFEFSGGEAYFEDARFRGGTVHFTQAEFSGGAVEFSADFAGSAVSFSGSKFSGGTVDFTYAKFSGGTADFSEAIDWSFPPTFPWTDIPPQEVKLPKKKDQSKSLK